MKVAVVTDSNSGISQKEAKELGIFIVPMPFLIDDEEYFEDINLTQEEFYKKLISGAEVSTSQPSANSLAEIWENALKQYDEIVHIPMSGGLSASVETAKHIAEQYDGKVQVVDNRRISVPQKISVYDALKLSKEGKNAKEIKEFLEKTAPLNSIYIMLTTLKYLKKGGRITPAVAALGSLLKIKPVLTIQGDKLDKFAQVISYQQGKKKMLDQITKEIETRFKDIYKQGKLKIFMAYTYVSDKIEEFRKEADEALKKYNLKVEIVDPLALSIACHIGDGAIAIACCYEY